MLAFSLWNLLFSRFLFLQFPHTCREQRAERFPIQLKAHSQCGLFHARKYLGEGERYQSKCAFYAQKLLWTTSEIRFSSFYIPSFFFSLSSLSYARFHFFFRFFFRLKRLECAQHTVGAWMKKKLLLRETFFFLFSTCQPIAVFVRNSCKNRWMAFILTLLRNKMWFFIYNFLSLSPLSL